VEGRLEVGRCGVEEGTGREERVRFKTNNLSV